VESAKTGGDPEIVLCFGHAGRSPRRTFHFVVHHRGPHLPAENYRVVARFHFDSLDIDFGGPFERFLTSPRSHDGLHGEMVVSAAHAHRMPHAIFRRREVPAFLLSGTACPCCDFAQSRL
jgi:hypothetical protein